MDQKQSFSETFTQAYSINQEFRVSSQEPKRTADAAVLPQLSESDSGVADHILDPVGLFARDLKECLAAQLAERDRLDPAMARLLENLELLARRELCRLADICDVDAEDRADIIAELRSLDPKPGSPISDFTGRYTQSTGKMVALRRDEIFIRMNGQ
jgi:DNA-directed RNA polymerase specialized sigma54-like protein